MQVIPSIDLDGGRSRTVYWPGAASGVGAPTDRPERIAETFVAMGARLIHLVDFGGARAGVPVEPRRSGRSPRGWRSPSRSPAAWPRADAIRLVFAAGATRVVLGTDIADQPDELRACLSVAGDWLAVGLDPRPERLAAYPVAARVAADGRDPRRGAGRRRGRAVRPEPRRRASRTSSGCDRSSGRTMRRSCWPVASATSTVCDASRDAGVAGVILGEALLTGAIDYPEALAAVA